VLWWSFAYSTLFTEFSLYCNHRNCMVVLFYSDYFFIYMLYASMTFGVKIPTLHAWNTNMCMIWYIKSFKFSILRLHGWKNAETEVVWSIKCFCVNIWYKISGVTVRDCCDQNSVSYISHLNHFAYERTIIYVSLICHFWM
jgi:hypothetical protein